MRLIKKWELPVYDRDAATAIARGIGLPVPLCGVLAARGAENAADADLFLQGTEGFQSPEVFADMDKATARIESAIENGERICVYGDYDCDGVTATALLTTYLSSVGADVFYYIPDRESEGYGMNCGAVDTLHSMQTNLIITVDNGISAHNEVEYAKSLGIDVVITDHHTPRDTLPDAPVVNPHRADCPSTYKNLAGVGVAFHLICALERVPPEELLEHYSDLVAIGTIADVVPLTGENRMIVRHGLELIPESPRPGIHALMEIAGVSGKITARSVAFGLSPRINAAGRLGDVSEAVELLMCEDPGYAPEIAATLDDLNRRRREIENDVMLEIERKLERNPELRNRRVLLLSGRGWHHGVVGIVASRMMERYGKPCIIFAVDDESARGSGRSIEGFSLIEAISACKERLTRYGGHKLAAGLTLPISELAWFGQELERFCAERYPIMPIQTVNVDCILEPSELTIENARAFEMLEPFGADNPVPRFALMGMTISAIVPSQDRKHLRLTFEKSAYNIKAMYFNMDTEHFPYEISDCVDLIVQAEAGEYRGSPQLSVIIREIRPAGFEADEILEDYERYQHHLRREYEGFARDELAPGRDDVAAVYRLMRSRKGAASSPELLYAMSEKVIGFGKLLIALDILEELGLAVRSGSAFRLVATQAKVELENSRIYIEINGVTV